jgi:hypothetical protein
VEASGGKTRIVPAAQTLKVLPERLVPGVGSMDGCDVTAPLEQLRERERLMHGLAEPSARLIRIERGELDCSETAAGTDLACDDASPYVSRRQAGTRPEETEMGYLDDKVATAVEVGGWSARAA